MKNFSSDSQRLTERGGSDWNNHELLKVDVVIGVRAAIDDVHHRHRQRARIWTTEISIKGDFKIGRSRAGSRHGDRKSTRLNSSHSQISYAVFCLKKKNK